MRGRSRARLGFGRQPQPLRENSLFRPASKLVNSQPGGSAVMANPCWVLVSTQPPWPFGVDGRPGPTAVGRAEDGPGLCIAAPDDSDAWFCGGNAPALWTGNGAVTGLMQ
jgi:hypothetical protein